MKNKKIISLICAIAMVFSMFSAFTVANAENAKGIALTGFLSENGKEITIEADAIGTTTDFFNSFQIELNVPDDIVITPENVESKITATSPHGTVIIGCISGKLEVGLIDMTGNGIPFTNKKLVTIKIRLDKPLSTDYVATLGKRTTFDDGKEIGINNGTMDIASVTIKKYNE